MAKYKGSFTDNDDARAVVDREEGALYVGGELVHEYPDTIEVYMDEPYLWVPPSDLANALESGDDLEQKTAIKEVGEAWLSDEDTWEEEHGEEEEEEEGEEDPQGEEE